MKPRNEADRGESDDLNPALAKNKGLSSRQSTAEGNSRRALPRRRGTFPTGDFRRLAATGTLGDWLVVSTATRLSVVGMESSS